MRSRGARPRGALLAAALLLAALCGARAARLAPQAGSAARAPAAQQESAARRSAQQPTVDKDGNPQPQQKHLTILCLGDSLTLGSVPSLNISHPYTTRMETVLEKGLDRPVDVVNAGVGGAGAFAVGFNNPVTLLPHTKEFLARDVQYDWVIAIIGINDLLRVGKSADEEMKGLLEIYTPALESGANVMAIAPLAAPGFVGRDDPKEAERRRLQQLLLHAADSWNSAHPQGPEMTVLDLGVDGPMDFWRMSELERKRWLDDGLHLTVLGYDVMGQIIGEALVKAVKEQEAKQAAYPAPQPAPGRWALGAASALVGRLFGAMTGSTVGLR